MTIVVNDKTREIDLLVESLLCKLTDMDLKLNTLERENEQLKKDLAKYEQTTERGADDNE